MSVSIDPVIGFDFTSSASSIFGEALTLTASGGATRDANGLDLRTSGYIWDADLPAALELTLPITFMVRVNHQATGTTDSFYLAARQSGGNIAYGMQHRQFSAANRVQGLNATTLVTVNTSYTPAAGVVTYFVELKAAAYDAWADTTDILTSTAARSNPTYDGTERLVFGRSTLGAYVTHAAIWDGLLTGTDRTDLVADPLAFMPAAPAVARSVFPFFLR